MLNISQSEPIPGMMSMTHELQSLEHFDDEIESSDQTICGRRNEDCLKNSGYTSYDGNRAAYNVSEGQDSFFPDSSDENVNSCNRVPDRTKKFGCKSSHKNRISKNTVPSIPLQNSATFSGPRRVNSTRAPFRDQSRLHFGEIQFPHVRTILWDRRVLASPCSLPPSALQLQFTVNSDLVSEILRVSRLEVSSVPCCWLVGSYEKFASCGTNCTSVILSRSPDASADGWKIPVYLFEHLMNVSASEYAVRMSSLEQKYKCDREVAGPKDEAHVILVRKSQQNVEVTVETFRLQIPLTFSIITSLPLLMTPVTAKLQENDVMLFDKNELLTGFVTLDQARKIVPLLQLDPLVSRRPIVGIWIIGALHMESNWDQIRANLSKNRAVYNACISFLVSPLVKERVTPAPNTFLVVLFPRREGNKNVHNMLPRFLECKYAEEWLEVIDSRDLKSAIVLESDVQTCLTNIQGHEEDIVLHPKTTKCPNANWDKARKEQNVKLVTPRSLVYDKGVAGSNVDKTKCTVNGPASDFKARTTNCPTKISNELAKPKSTACAESESNHDLSSLKDCCVMQKKLTLHHQDLLESQQKQLHALQDQLRELQQIVELSRNTKLDAPELHSGSAERSKLDESVNYSELSSLSLSSISQHSAPSQNLSDLSSLPGLCDGPSQETSESSTMRRQSLPNKDDTFILEQALHIPQSVDTSQTAETSCSHASSASARQSRHLELPLPASVPERIDSNLSIVIPKIKTNHLSFSSYSDDEDEELKQIKKKYAQMLRSKKIRRPT